jgi:hypothetical protein
LRHGLVHRAPTRWCPPAGGVFYRIDASPHRSRAQVPQRRYPLPLGCRSPLRLDLGCVLPTRAPLLAAARGPGATGRRGAICESGSRRFAKVDTPGAASARRSRSAVGRTLHRRCGVQAILVDVLASRGTPAAVPVGSTLGRQGRRDTGVEYVTWWPPGSPVTRAPLIVISRPSTSPSSVVCKTVSRLTRED